MVLCFIFIGCKRDTHITFALISDNHYGASANANDDMVQAVEDINASDDIDFVIMSGDLTEFGVTSEFAGLKEVLDKLEKPLYMVDGNHDVNWSENGTTTFKNFFTVNAPRFVFDNQGIRFIGCGSGPMLRMGSPHIPREEINWLKRVLDTTDINQPIIFVNHFPMFDELTNVHEVTNLLRTRNVQYVLCGHFHSNDTKEFNGVKSVLGRSLLRKRDPMGGYNIVTITADSIRLAEKITKGEVLPAWFSAPITWKYKDSGEHLDISYAINEQYPQVKEVWRINEVSDIASQGEIDGDFYVYTTTGGKAVALNATNGGKIWEYQTEDKIFSAPFITDDAVYISSTDGFIYSLARKDGSLLWKFDTGYPIVACPVVADNDLYVGSSNGKFYSLDKLSGKLNWCTDGFEGYMESRPAVDKNNIYTGGWEGRFWAINRKNGKMEWEHNIGRGRYFSPGACWPAISNGEIFIQSSDNVLRAYTPSGKIKWENRSANGRESMSISPDSKTLYLKGTANIFTAFDLTKKGYPVKWEAAMPYEYNYIPTAPLEVSGLVLAADTFGEVCAIAANGKGLQWRYKISNCAVTSLCRTADGGAIAMTMDGKIVKLVYPQFSPGL